MDNTETRTVVMRLMEGGYIWHLSGCNGSYAHSWGRSHAAHCTCGLRAIMEDTSTLPVPIHSEDCR